MLAAGSSSMLLFIGMPTSASAGEVVPSSKTLEASCFSADWSTRHYVSFTIRCDFPRSARASGDATLTWDPVLFSVSECVLLRRGSSMSVAETLDHGDGRVTFRLDPMCDAAWFSAQPRDLFSLENLPAAPSPTLFTYTEASRSAPRSITFTTRDVPVTPWGARIHTSWTTADSLALPSLITVESLGPSPIPSGCSVVIDWPNRVQAATQVEADKSQISESLGKVNSQTLIILDEPIPAGESLMITTDAQGSREEKPTLSLVSTVSLRAPDIEKDNMRVANAGGGAMITSSGDQVSDFSPAKNGA